MELAAEYTFLSRHISKYGNWGPEHLSYVSFYTYEHFISIMSEKIIIVELKTVTYFLIDINSTPVVNCIE